MNLKDDYELIRQATEGRKRQDAIDGLDQGPPFRTYVPDHCPIMRAAPSNTHDPFRGSMTLNSPLNR